jgi:hypothetical protein
MIFVIMQRFLFLLEIQRIVLGRWGMWHLAWHAHCKNGPGGLFAGSVEMGKSKVGIPLHHADCTVSEKLGKSIEINPSHLPVP